MASWTNFKTAHKLICPGKRLVVISFHALKTRLSDISSKKRTPKWVTCVWERMLQVKLRRVHGYPSIKRSFTPRMKRFTSISAHVQPSYGWLQKRTIWFWIWLNLQSCYTITLDKPSLTAHHLYENVLNLYEKCLWTRRAWASADRTCLFTLPVTDERFSNF